MKKFLNLSIIFILMISTVICFGGCKFFKTADPANPQLEQPQDSPTAEEAEIVYVSLGDSIPDGVSLNKYSQKDASGFVEGSYAYTYRAYLQEKYSRIYAVSYAESGQTSTQLLAELQGLSDEVLDSATQKMKNDIMSADIITICIGANDILGPARANLVQFITSNADLTPYLDVGLSTFTTNFPLILEELEELNPNAKLLFSNVYNPYKEYTTATKSISVSMGYFSTTITEGKIREMGTITEVYLDSGSLNDGKIIENGLNQIVENNIEGKDNCVLLDVKQSFDAYFSRELELGENKYDVVQTDVLLYDSITLAEIETRIDPHPTDKGHALIAQLLLNWHNSLS